MMFFYVGLVGIIFGILGKFLLETYKLMMTLLFNDLTKIDLIIKVLELVDMTMVAQLVWVVALAGVSLFVTTGHFDKADMKKPDWRGCKKFCVNGYLAGNCLPSRKKRNDRYQRTDR
jgi:uncharacterized membrane protein YqhA